ncbi:hypothetical protein L9F63_011978, partial [Diploptera punctata]
PILLTLFYFVVAIGLNLLSCAVILDPFTVSHPIFNANKPKSNWFYSLNKFKMATWPSLGPDQIVVDLHKISGLLAVVLRLIVPRRFPRDCVRHPQGLSASRNYKPQDHGQQPGIFFLLIKVSQITSSNFLTQDKIVLRRFYIQNRFTVYCYERDIFIIIYNKANDLCGFNL